MSSPHPDPAARSSGPVRHVLSDDSIARILAVIRDAHDTRHLVAGTIRVLYDAMQGGSTTGSRRSTSQDPIIRPGDYALPSAQWHAIITAVTQRAQQWGTQAEAGLELALNLMPGQYDDPTVPAPPMVLPDYRPAAYTLVWARDAVDVVTACASHLDRLRDAYGLKSPFYLHALHSWLQCLSAVIAMNTGPTTTVSKNGPMDLLVSTSSGLIYGVIFHGAARRCTVAGCGAQIRDDGTVQPTDTGIAVAEHRHVASYPPGGPQPGTWSPHS